MNRAQRRAQQRMERQQKKRQPAYMKLSKDARIDALIKNASAAKADMKPMSRAMCAATRARNLRTLP